MKKVNLLSKTEMKRVLGGTEPGGLEPGEDGPKIKACYEKKLNEACTWEYLGTPQPGKCLQFGVSVLHCSDLPE